MTQNQAIQQVLEKHRNQWVEMPTLARAADCFAVHSRIADLRKRGLRIRNKTEVGKTGKKLSFYMLEVPR